MPVAPQRKTLAGRLEDFYARRHMRQVCASLFDPLFIEFDRSLDLFSLRPKRRDCAYLSHALKCKAKLEISFWRLRLNTEKLGASGGRHNQVHCAAFTRSGAI
jgi:hypothetical protein